MNRACIAICLTACFFLSSCHTWVVPLSEDATLAHALPQTNERAIATIAAAMHLSDWRTAPHTATRIGKDAVIITIGTSPSLGTIVRDDAGLLREFIVGSTVLHATAYAHPMHAKKGVHDAWTGDALPPETPVHHKEHRCALQDVTAHMQSFDAIDPYAHIGWIDTPAITDDTLITASHNPNAKLIYVHQSEGGDAPYGVRAIIHGANACTLIGLAHPYDMHTTRYVPLQSLLSTGTFHLLDRH